jgi:crotonobetainyl-CoA:carnitine CoA-transferase CaiB-like acyl-CoA transferase
MSGWKRSKGAVCHMGPVNSIQRAIDHPQTEARDMIESIDFEAAVDGVLKLLGLFCSVVPQPKVRPLQWLADLITP